MVKLDPTSAAAFAEIMSTPAKVIERLLEALRRPVTATWFD